MTLERKILPGTTLDDTGENAIVVADDPDTTVPNARGTRAIDLQMARNASDDVASGDDSLLIGGNNNSASATLSGCVGGQNIVNSTPSGYTIGGGGNTLAETGSGSSTMLGGTNHSSTSSGSLNTFSGGTQNTMSGATTAGIIIGGQSNTISIGSFQTIIGSFLCTTANTAGLGSVIASTNSNITTTGQLASVMNSVGCNNGGLISGIFGGSANTIVGGTACTIMNGGSNTIAAGTFGGTIINGFGSTVSAAFQVLLNGTMAPIREGEIAYGGASFAAAGDAASGLNQLCIPTTDATPSELLIQTGIVAGSGFIVPVDAATSIDVQLIAKSDVGDVASWHFTVLLDDNAGVLALISPGAAIAPTHSTAGIAAAWTVTPAALAAPNRLGLTVVGTAATNVRWLANTRIAEVIYA